MTSPPPSLQDPHLEGLAQDVAEIIERTGAVLKPLDRESINWRKDDASWSVGQCLEHLIKVDSLYQKAIHEAVEKARQRGRTRKGPFKGSWLGSWASRAVGPGFKRPVKAPGIFRPEDETHEVEVVDRFLTTQRGLLGCLADADGLDLDGIKVSSPLSRLIRFRLGDAFRFVVEHDKRHMAQAERVVAEPGFPAP